PAADAGDRCPRARQARANRGRSAAPRVLVAPLRRIQGQVSSRMSRQFAGTLRASNAGESITLNGWVQKQRDFGELIFVDVRDRSGVCQVVIDRERGAGDELIAIAKELRSEFVVQIDGNADMRAESQRNPKIATGDVELVATKIEILSR